METDRNKLEKKEKTPRCPSGKLRTGKLEML